MASGGARKPANPAPVSGPGALSQRTDGGPGDRKLGTANLAESGGSYGDRQTVEGQAAQAPVVVEGGGASTAPSSGAAGPGGDIGVFGPTERPNESITAGVPQIPGAEPDTEMILRALYEQFPSSYLGRLLYD